MTVAGGNWGALEHRGPEASAGQVLLCGVSDVCSIKLMSFAGLSQHTTCSSPRGRELDDTSSGRGRFPGHLSSAGSRLALTRARGLLCPLTKAWEGEWVQTPLHCLWTVGSHFIAVSVSWIGLNQTAQTRWLTRQEFVVSQIWGLEGQDQGASRLGPLPGEEGACTLCSPCSFQTAVLAFTGVPPRVHVSPSITSLVGLGPVLMVSSDYIC